MQTALLDSPHKDTLTSIAYNFTGSLFATSSLDHSVCIFQKESKGDWVQQDTLKLDCPVLKITFGLGEYEHLLAAGLADGSARLFAYDPTTSTWKQRAQLAEGRGSLRDLAFGPFDVQALKMVTLAADCCLRLYECLSPIDTPSSTSGLANWTLLETIDLMVLPPSPCSSQSTGTISGFASIPTASGISAGTSRVSNVSSTSSNTKSGRSNIEALSGYSLSWCKETYFGECLAVAAGPQGILRVFELSGSSGWIQPLVVVPTGFTAQTAPAITSLDWAPACGRSYQLVAAGYKDGVVRLFKLHPPPKPISRTTSPSLSDLDAWAFEQIAELKEHVGSIGGVSKVEFNITGSILSTAGDEVRLWKPTYSGEWRPHAILTTTAEPENPNQMTN